MEVLNRIDLDRLNEHKNPLSTLSNYIRNAISHKDKPDYLKRKKEGFTEQPSAPNPLGELDYQGNSRGGYNGNSYKGNRRGGLRGNISQGNNRGAYQGKNSQGSNRGEHQDNNQEQAEPSYWKPGGCITRRSSW